MTLFDVWAPSARQVHLQIGAQRLAMQRHGEHWRLDLPDAEDGTDYGFCLDGADPLPDPRSPWQPNGVHASSRTVDHGRFAWTDGRWRGVALPGAVLYEMHIGTFTTDGTFEAAIERLGHLVDLGITAVEVMPVAAFPGRYGWGYDGVHLWAVHDPYGGPEGFKRFVDACHSLGLGVVLDVVHNHLGPSGNYLARFGPYFTERYVTPWGAAVNLDDPGSDEVRRWIIESSLMWLRDYHLDGLRLDAVHALHDEGAIHLLEDLATEVDSLAVSLGRPLFLVAESDLNDARMVTPREAGGAGVTGQWCDDIHHALHAHLTGENQGYYSDFAPLAALAKTLEGAFLHDGSWSSFRGRRHGRPVDRLRTPGWRFVTFLQNHDQIGNRALGDRMVATIGVERAMAGATLLLTSPFTPLLFMGEEWGASTPWQFFTDHQDPEVAQAVAAGRKSEFAAHGWDADDVPDPQDPHTARRSILDWSEIDGKQNARILAWYRQLLRLRRTIPDLSDPRLHRVRVQFDADGGWLLVHRGSLRVGVNLGSEPAELSLGTADADLLLASSPSVVINGDLVRLPPDASAIVRLR